jgi:hypothetical protein
MFHLLHSPLSIPTSTIDGFDVFKILELIDFPPNTRAFPALTCVTTFGTGLVRSAHRGLGTVTVAVKPRGWNLVRHKVNLEMTKAAI